MRTETERAAGVLSAAVIGIGFVLLIVPGLIAMLGLILATPITVERRVGPVDALKMSWAMTNGHKRTILNVVVGAGILWALITIPLRGLEEASYALLSSGSALEFAAISAPIVLLESVPGALVVASVYSRLRSTHVGHGDSPA